MAAGAPAVAGQPFVVRASASARQAAARLYPGLLATSTVALAATWLAQHYRSPVMLFALLFGLALNFLTEEGRCGDGIDFAATTVLRWGVALLGARITLGQVLSLGWSPLVLVLAGVVSTIGFGVLGSRLLRLPRSFGVLSGGAVGICGASAALAIAAVLPAHKDRQRDTALAVVIVTTLSTMAMIAYPPLAVAAHLPPAQAGLFLGGTIHDVAQVVGAGYAVSPTTGDVAAVVKLFRVSLLVPIVMAIGMSARSKPEHGQRRSLPWPPIFLFGFALMICLRSLALIPDPAATALSEVSRWCLTIAIAGLGMKTSLKSLTSVGWRPVTLMAAETVWLAAAIFFGLKVLV